jgi:hypothetical protein
MPSSNGMRRELGTAAVGLPHSQCLESSVYDLGANDVPFLWHVVPVIHESNQMIQFRGLPQHQPTLPEDQPPPVRGANVPPTISLSQLLTKMLRATPSSSNGFSNSFLAWIHNSLAPRGSFAGYPASSRRAGGIVATDKKIPALDGAPLKVIEL